MVVSITFVSQIKYAKTTSIVVFDNVVFLVVAVGVGTKLKPSFDQLSCYCRLFLLKS